MSWKPKSKHSRTKPDENPFDLPPPPGQTTICFGGTGAPAVRSSNPTKHDISIPPQSFQVQDHSIRCDSDHSFASHHLVVMGRAGKGKIPNQEMVFGKGKGVGKVGGKVLGKVPVALGKGKPFSAAVKGKGAGSGGKGKMKGDESVAPPVESTPPAKQGKGGKRSAKAPEVSPEPKAKSVLPTSN